MGDVAQLGERLPCTQEASGSSPLISTNLEVSKSERTSEPENKNEMAMSHFKQTLWPY